MLAWLHDACLRSLQAHGRRILAWEREQADKHEFDAGEAFPVAGESPRHHWIAGNIQSALKHVLDDRCFTFTSDQRITFDNGARYVYPDAGVVCGQVKLQEGTTDVLVNPTILVEVFSPGPVGTEARTHRATRP